MDLDYRPKVQARLVDVYYPDGQLAGRSRVIRCPYCEREHTHGEPLGIRSSHCLPQHGLKTNDAYGNPGYELCDPDDDVDWDLERLHARLWVLRSQYRRLRAEYDRMEPLSARERRVKQTLQAQTGTWPRYCERPAWTYDADNARHAGPTNRRAHAHAVRAGSRRYRHHER